MFSHVWELDEISYTSWHFEIGVSEWYHLPVSNGNYACVDIFLSRKIHQQIEELGLPSMSFTSQNIHYTRPLHLVKQIYFSCEDYFA